MRTTFAIVLLVCLTGCGRKQSADSTPVPSVAIDSTASGAVAEHATAPRPPHQIAELTDQVVVFECHKCGMMFDSPGNCTMDQSTLYPARVSYLCPADLKATAHAGKCPRCAQNTRIMKTAVGPEGIKLTRVN